MLIKYRTKLCRSWHETGTCVYGERCCFSHEIRKEPSTESVETDNDATPTKARVEQKVNDCFQVSVQHSSANLSPLEVFGKVFVWRSMHLQSPYTIISQASQPETRIIYLILFYFTFVHLVSFIGFSLISTTPSNIVC